MILVAGIGNIFLGDDGWGVEVVRRLAERSLPPEVQVRDFGIRGMDLAFALMDPWDAVIMVDAAARDEPPGTVTLLQADTAAEDVAMDTHGWQPDKVIALARGMGATPAPIYVVACEPETLLPEASEDVLANLSPPASGAVDGAIAMVEELVASLLTEGAVHA